jgi:hypothetical protein
MIGLLRRYQFISLSLDGNNTLKRYSPWAQPLLKAYSHINEQVILETIDDLHQWLSAKSILTLIQKIPSF